MSFLKGFIGGAAEAVEASVLEDMEQYEDDMSALAKIRFERGYAAKEEWDNTVKENKNIIDDMARKVGGPDAVQFLIDEYGFAEAQNVASLLYERQNKTGGVFNIQEELALEQRTGGNAPVTTLQLAEFITPAYSIPDVEAEYTAPGIMGFFGADADAQVTARSNKFLAEAGVPTDMKTSIDDLPDVVGGQRIPEWKLYTLDNPAADAKRLLSVAKQLYQSGDNDGAFEAKALADARIFEANSLKNVNREYTPEQIKSKKNNIVASLASAVGAADKGQYQQGVYVNTSMEAEQFSALETAADTIILVTSQAFEAGVDPATITAMETKAYQTNQRLVFTPSDDFLSDGGVLSLVPDSTLIPDRKKLFPSSTVIPLNGNPNANLNVTASLPQNLSNAIARNRIAYQQSNRQVDRDKIVKDVLAMGIINPNSPTGAKFTEDEIRKLLEQ